MQNLAKDSVRECRMGPCQLYTERTWRCLHSSMSRNNTFLLKLLINDSKNTRFFFPAFLVFSDEKKFDVEHHFITQNDRVGSGNGDEGSRMVTRNQCAASVMIWEAVTESGKILLFFVDQGDEIEPAKLSRWHSRWRIVALGTEALKKTSLVFSARFRTITLRQKTQERFSENVPHFIPKEEWPWSSPDMNPLDFGIWSYLESKVSDTHHKSLEARKVKLQEEWAKFPQKVIRDTCKAFPKCLQLVIDADGGHIE